MLDLRKFIDIVLDASQIISGRFGMGRMPAGTSGQVLTAQGAGNDPIYAAAASYVEIASNDLRNSNDTDKYTTSLTIVKIKETKLNAALAAARIKFDLNAGVAGGIAYARIYKNGVAIGALSSVTGTTPSTFSEDFSGFVIDDLIQVYGYMNDVASNACHVLNFRFYYTGVITKIAYRTLTSSLLVSDDPTISMTNQDP